MKRKKINTEYPSLLKTIKLAFSASFFSEKGLLFLLLNNRHTFNLITVFLFMTSLPVKGLDGKIAYSFGHIIETILLTLFFIVFLFLLSPNKKFGFLAFLRVFMAYECIDIFALISLVLPTNFISTFYSLHIGWYLALAVFAYSKINRANYVYSTINVLLAFFIVNLLPAIL
ncbi:hypothetical protein [Deferribacter desulfuricans]|nr:hypothetical protein [Deferribacter desulfuricans]